jgi:serine/threonine protein kinase
MTASQTATNHEPIDDLADDFLARYRRGERPSITEYVTVHPELADEIRELFPTLVMLERLGPRSDEIARQRPPAVDDQTPKQLGEYRILREVGRGGMGIVYEAEQISLGRHVALKVLPAHAVLNPSLLTRFQNEARVAARLHHTNIVPVFGVGEDQGIHYYAMQFIQGHGLDEVLAELRRQRTQAPKPKDGNVAPPGPSPHGPADSEVSDPFFQSVAGNSTNHSSHGIFLRSVARMGLQVAEALAHAHGQGVLHRDIKPSNLLLDMHGVVWITDFGLAKQAGSDLTQSGDVVGTLRYLAPERFSGIADARADIYGLGVALYELLTLRPAFPATDRHRLIRDIAHTEPVLPRGIEPRIPRDLETIVLKAMAKEPKQRYETAVDMAADLRRFLDDQPIAARRARTIERMWRWCARRPALAGLSAALLLSMVVGMVGVIWQWSRAEANLDEAVRQKGLAESSLIATRAERERAGREAERAEANYRTARLAVDEFQTIATEDELRSQPALRVRLLTRALQYYQGMLSQRADDPKARSDLAANHLRVAAIKRLTGPINEARDSYDKAIGLLESAIGESREDRDAVLSLVNAYNELSSLQIDDRDYADAQRGLERARELVENIVEAVPESIPAQYGLAMTLNNVAWCLSQSPERNHPGRLDEVLELHRQALAIYGRIGERQPDDYELNRGISITLSNMARRNFDARRFDVARPLFDETLKIRQDLARRKPDSLDMQALLAATYKALGDIVLRSPTTPDGWFDQALAHYEQAIDIQERLVRNNPAVVYYRHQAFLTLKNMSDLCVRNKDSQHALELRRRANNLLQPCLAHDSASMFYHLTWAETVRAQAELEHKLEHDADALASRYRARDVWRVIQENRNVFDQNRNSAIKNLAGLMGELGSQSRLADVYEIALEQKELCDGRHGPLLDLTWEIQRSIWAATRGAMLDDDAKHALERCLNLAIAVFEQGAQGAPDQLESFVRAHAGMRNYETVMRLNSDLAKNPDNVDALTQRSALLHQLGHSRQASADWDRAAQLLVAKLEKSPGNIAALRQRALLHFVARHWTETFVDATSVLKSRPKDIAILRRRAIAARNLGHWQQAQTDNAQILAQFPTDTSCLKERCRASFELGQPHEIASDMRRLHEVIGQDGARANAAAWQFVESAAAPRLPEDVLSFVQRAVELDPRVDPRIALGGIYCQLGRDREAIETLAPFGDIVPSTPAVLRQFWLAMCWHRLGDDEKAQQAFHRAVRLWKSVIYISPSREDFLKATWQEAKSLLAGSEIDGSRS